nr:uncharacterized protein LOC115256257 [Aedes albopictus]
MGFPTMVAIAVFAGLAIFLSLGEAAAPEQNRGHEVCSGRFEVFTQCGSACPKTCNGRNNNNDRNCAQVCVPGCVCQRGYIRNQRWQCVNPNQCKRQGSGGPGHNGGNGGGGRPFYDDFVPDGTPVADAVPAVPAAPAAPHTDVKH